MPHPGAHIDTPESGPSCSSPRLGTPPDSGKLGNAAIGRHTVRLDLWIPTVYAVLSCAWIFLSGRLVTALARSSQQQANWETLKGFGFVAVTAALLHAGLR